MSDVLDALIETSVERISAQVEDRIRGCLARLLRSEIQVVYSESEAAEFLKVSKGTLQAWRKRGLIDYTQYPIGRIREGGERLSEVYSYSLADLLNFHDRFRVRSRRDLRFEVSRTLTLLGPEIREAK